MKPAGFARLRCVLCLHDCPDLVSYLYLASATGNRRQRSGILGVIEPCRPVLWARSLLLKRHGVRAKNDGASSVQLLFSLKRSPISVEMVHGSDVRIQMDLCIQEAGDRSTGAETPQNLSRSRRQADCAKSGWENDITWYQGPICTLCTEADEQIREQVSANVTLALLKLPRTSTGDDQGDEATYCAKAPVKDEPNYLPSAAICRESSAESEG